MAYVQNDVKLQTIKNNNISMRLASVGEGPLVVLLHGWPESWYSWRHQLVALANAGYKAVAPDMPGYGETDRLAAVEDYNIVNLASLVVGILDEMKATQAVLIGHDWGAAIAWQTALLHPERFSKLITLSVPYNKHAPIAPMEIYKKRFGEHFFYQLYFQTPGVAEKEFDAAPDKLLRRLYVSPDTPKEKPAITDTRAEAGGFIERLGEPKRAPDWLTEEDLNYFVSQFQKAGFEGGINYYRNINRNWELLAPYADRKIEMPTLFMAGERDLVINGMMAGGPDPVKLKEGMLPLVPNIEDVILLPNIGHWIQQEAPEAVNKAILGFLTSSEQ